MSCFCLKDILCYRKEGRIPVTLISHIQFASEYDSSRVRKSLLAQKRPSLWLVALDQIGSSKRSLPRRRLVSGTTSTTVKSHVSLLVFSVRKDSTKKLSKEKSKVRENCQSSFFSFPLGSWRRWQSLGSWNPSSWNTVAIDIHFSRLNMIFFFFFCYISLSHFSTAVV